MEGLSLPPAGLLEGDSEVHTNSPRPTWLQDPKSSTDTEGLGKKVGWLRGGPGSGCPSVGSLGGGCQGLGEAALASVPREGRRS